MQARNKDFDDGEEGQTSHRVPAVLKRYQRALLYGAGVAMTVVLLVLGGTVIYLMVRDYIDNRYIGFAVRKTQLELELLQFESILRYTVLHEESAWERREPPPSSVVEQFAAQHGRILLQQHADFPPVLALGDVTNERPAQTFAPYLAMTREFDYRVGPYAVLKGPDAVTGYFYTPDYSFMSIYPAPASGNPLDAGDAPSVRALLDQIRPDIGDLSKKKTLRRLETERELILLPPITDRFTGEQVIRMVLPAFADGTPFLIFVRTIPVRLLFDHPAQEPLDDEISLIVDASGKVVLDAGPAGRDSALKARVLRTKPWAPGRQGIERRRLGGLFIASAPVSHVGWTLVYAFTWRTVLAEFWPRITLLTLAVLLVIGFLWTILLLLDRKIFKPGFEYSRRIFESERLNRMMVAAAPEGFALLLFESGDILLESDAMRSYGANAHPDERPLRFQLLELYDRSPDAPAWQSGLQLPFRLANGGVEDLLVSLVRTQYRSVDVLLCSFSNVTKLKNTERKLEEARAAADAANHAKSAFLAMMSHEIRTPLNAILGNLELLGRSSLSPAQSERLHVVTSSSTALLDIINDILDFSKVESGQMTIEAIRFDLAETIRQVGAIFAPMAHAKGLEFECMIDDSIAPYYLGDPTRIRQIVANFVSNAIKFTETGNVLLEVYHKDETVDGSPVMIGVIDSGIGMTPAQQETLFQAFVQADSSIARRYGGTGLGLALCSRLTRLMNGSIIVKSSLELGSTFVVSLPLRVDTSASASAADSGEKRVERDAAPAGTAALRILVVDDQPANRELIVAQLDLLGYRADMADSGATALRCFNEQHYDVVMTDLNMPGMDGYTLARCLRGQGATTPIIAATAHVGAEEQRRCEDAGIDATLLKPILLDAMEQVLRRSIGAEASGTLPPGDRTAKRDISQGPLPPGVHAALKQSLGESLAKLQKAMSTHDTQAALDTLHAMRGSFALIHEAALANACAQMEQLARDDDLAGVEEMLGRFETLAYETLVRRQGAVSA